MVLDWISRIDNLICYYLRVWSVIKTTTKLVKHKMMLFIPCLSVEVKYVCSVVLEWIVYNAFLFLS